MLRPNEHNSRVKPLIFKGYSGIIRLSEVQDVIREDKNYLIHLNNSKKSFVLLDCEYNDFYEQWNEYLDF